MTLTEIRKRLEALADEEYRKFQAGLLPGTANIVGVRIPQLRKLAQELARQTDWRVFANRPDTRYYEETMLQGLVIGKAKMDFDERKEHTAVRPPYRQLGGMRHLLLGAEAHSEERTASDVAIHTALPALVRRV